MDRSIHEMAIKCHFNTGSWKALRNGDGIDVGSEELVKVVGVDEGILLVVVYSKYMKRGNVIEKRMVKATRVRNSNSFT
jgi:flagellar biogenesis protein FliO